MPVEAARASGPAPAGFEDGLGLRFRPATRGVETPVEILCFRHEITDTPAFDFALRERVARLSDLNHPYFARVKKVDRLNDPYGTVTLTSDATVGVRLSEILKNAERGGPAIDLNAALYLVRQLLSAVGVLHQHAHVAHGAITPDRLFVTSVGRLVVVEHVLGAAVEQLNYSRERYWQELRVALPMRGGPPRFDERTDLTQIGVVALSLILGRPLRDAEFPNQTEEVVASAPASSGLREWLRRVLQLDVRNSFGSVSDAQTAMDESLSASEKASASAVPLEAFLTRYRAAAAFDLATTSRSNVAPETPARPIEAKPSVLEQDDEALESLPIETPTEKKLQERDEDEEPMKSPRAAKPTPGRMNLKSMAIGLLLLTAMGGGAFAARQFAPAAASPLGSISVTTDPPGAEVEIDGAKRGLTPINLSLAAGAHSLVVRGNGDSRTIPITLEAGAQVSQYLEFPKKAAAFGQLQIRTEPAGARVTLDGTVLGKSPLTATDLAPGEHTVTLEADNGSVTQKVTVEAGIQASLVVPMVAQGDTATGYLSVKAPVVMELYEQGRLLGTTGIDRILLPAGRHDIEVVSAPLDYRETRTFQVTPGRASTVTITLPKGTASINAVPWASVSIDGESVGDTPIANVPLTIGPHEVILKHATLGEQRRVITVTQRTPVRLGVDMTKQ